MSEHTIEKLTRALEERTSELKRVKEQLRAAKEDLTSQISARDKSEKLYKNLLENSPSLICTHDLNGVLLSVNAAAVNVLKHPIDELIGRNLRELVPSSVQYLFGAYLDRIRKFSHDAGLMQIMGRNGEERILIYQNILITEANQEPYVLGNAQDITDQFRAQRALHASDERYRLLFENNPYPMWVYDTQTYSMLAVNQSAIRNYGYTREEFLSLTIFDVRPAEDLERFKQHLANIGEQPNLETLWRHRKKDGSVIFVRTGAHPVTFEGKKARMVLAVNVTEQKNAEEALRRSEERFQYAARATNDAIWDFNVKENTTWVNEGFATLFGYTPDEIQPGAAGWHNRIHPDDKMRVIGNFSKAIEERRRFWSDDYRFRRKDGSYAYVFDRAFVILDDSGVALRVIGSMTDISDRKLAEERLAKQKEYFTILHETAINLMSRLDLNDVLQTIVSRMCAITKLPNAFLYLLDEASDCMTMQVGLGFSADFFGHRAHFGVGVVGKVWETGQPLTIEDYRNWPERASEPALKVLQSVSAVPLKSGARVIGVLGVETITDQHSFSKEELDVLMSFAQLASLAFDNARLYSAAQEELAERINAENALRKSEEKFRLLFEESKDVFFISSTDGRVTEINPAGLALFGYSSKEEMSGLNIGRDLFHDSSDRNAYQNLMKEQGYVKDFELHLRRKDGLVLTVLETAIAVLGADGDVVAYRGIMRDVTQLKQLQQQLLQWQKIETIGQLAGGVAHDFNNLLMAISGHCEVLAMKLPPNLPLSDLNEIKKAADAGASLTKQLLAFGRKQVLEPKIVNLNHRLEAMENMLRRLIGDRIELEFHLDRSLGTVKVDPGQFEQVILNLSVNARDAMPEGGKLSIQTQNIRFKNALNDPASSISSDHCVMITVRDTGTGMDPETMSHMFEPFFTTKKEAHGTGMGLPTVYGIVKQSGGHIVMESRIGGGTTFKIYLPRLDAPALEEQPFAPALQTEVKQISILLVDDNESILQAVRAFLDIQGFKVSSSNSPLLALELSKKMEQLDLLITDVMMPNMTGPQLAEALLKNNPRMKILFLSGYSGEAIRKDGVFNQGASFLQKPASMRDLMNKIQSLLNLPPQAQRRI